jgi:hypothetical protein
MATAQVLKVTHAVDDGVRAVNDKVLDVDNRVVGVDDRVTGVDNRVVGVDNRVAGVDDRVAGVDNRVAAVDNRVEAVEARVASVDDTVKAVDDKVAVVAGTQLRQDLHKWLSPPDPSTNHNIACGAHHKRTAQWFFQGSIFAEWKSTISLLRLHGKRTFSCMEVEPAPS